MFHVRYNFIFSKWSRRGGKRQIASFESFPSSNLSSSHSLFSSHFYRLRFFFPLFAVSWNVSLLFMSIRVLLPFCEQQNIHRASTHLPPSLGIECSTHLFMLHFPVPVLFLLEISGVQNFSSYNIFFFFCRYLPAVSPIFFSSLCTLSQIFLKELLYNNLL